MWRRGWVRDLEGGQSCRKPLPPERDDAAAAAAAATTAPLAGELKGMDNLLS